MLKKQFRQLGQGMTEYIIIVALIAIAAIAIYGFFGDTIRGQMGIMTAELAGTTTSKDFSDVQTTDSTAQRGLKDFSAGTK
ncbi:MAG: pilus assembly protein [Gammaproteobacteria bacterium]